MKAFALCDLLIMIQILPTGVKKMVSHGVSNPITSYSQGTTLPKYTTSHHTNHESFFNPLLFLQLTIIE